MKTSSAKKNLLLGVAAAAVLLGVLIAVLGGGGGKSSAKPADPATGISGASSYLGITPAQLRRRLSSGQSLQQIAASKPGASVSGLISAALAIERQRMQQAGVPAKTQAARLSRLRRRLLRRAHRAQRRATTLAGEAAAYLGLSAGEVQKRLAGGESLAQIASSSGHSRAGLVAAIAAARRHTLERAAASHQLTASEEQAAISTLQRRAAEAVARKGG